MFNSVVSYINSCHVWIVAPLAANDFLLLSLHLTLSYLCKFYLNPCDYSLHADLDLGYVGFRIGWSAVRAMVVVQAIRASAFHVLTYTGITRVPLTLMVTFTPCHPRQCHMATASITSSSSSSIKTPSRGTCLELWISTEETSIILPITIICSQSANRATRYKHFYTLLQVMMV